MRVDLEFLAFGVEPEVVEIGFGGEMQLTEFLSLFWVILDQEYQEIGFELPELGVVNGFVDVVIEFLLDLWFQFYSQYFMQLINEVDFSESQLLIVLYPPFQVLGCQGIFDNNLHICQIPVYHDHLMMVVVSAVVLLQYFSQVIEIDFIAKLKIGHDSQAEGYFERFQLEDLLIETQNDDHLFYSSQKGELFIQQTFKVGRLDLSDEVFLAFAVENAGDLAAVHQEKYLGLGKGVKGLVLVERRQSVEHLQGLQVGEHLGKAGVVVELLVEPVDFLGEDVGGPGQREGAPAEDGSADQSIQHIIISGCPEDYFRKVFPGALGSCGLIIIIMTKREVWITDNSNIKYQKIKGQFLESMQEQSKDQRINYYDFLLVAKKLSFRFEESSHLMALKNYFARNKNAVANKKIADLLCISQESLHAQQQKIIVKFNVPETEFAPIKEETLQDEEENNSEADLGTDLFEKMGGDMESEEEREINEKMAIILSIKVTEMDKKIRAIVQGEGQYNLFTFAEQLERSQYSYDEFRQLIILVLGSLKEKLKMSQDDIKTIFFLLDGQHQGSITRSELESLQVGLQDKLKEFYRTRINREMVKNTLFKLGKVKNNSIQIYQVKNASLLEFENIEKAIVEEKTSSKAIIKMRPAKVPHFGPLKGAALKQRMTVPAHQSAPKVGESDIKVQRDRIERILRVSKEQKRRQKKGETVASKLRSLFIHKVILPRQKMLQEEKERYLRNKVNDYQLAIRPSNR